MLCVPLRLLTLIRWWLKKLHAVETGLWIIWADPAALTMMDLSPINWSQMLTDADENSSCGNKKQHCVQERQINHSCLRATLLSLKSNTYVIWCILTAQHIRLKKKKNFQKREIFSFQLMRGICDVLMWFVPENLSSVSAVIWTMSLYWLKSGQAEYDPLSAVHSDQ